MLRHIILRPTKQYMFGETPANSNYGKVQVGTLSGTTLSFTTALTYNAGTTSYPNAVYDSAAEKTAIIYADDSNSDGVAKVYTTGYVETNFADFIGITDAAISDTASGSVTIKGGISTNVTGLTANLTYYVQSDGTLVHDILRRTSRQSPVLH